MIEQYEQEFLVKTERASISPLVKSFTYNADRDSKAQSKKETLVNQEEFDNFFDDKRE